jgi:hypothetical protein
VRKGIYRIWKRIYLEETEIWYEIWIHPEEDISRVLGMGFAETEECVVGSYLWFEVCVRSNFFLVNY